jgi:endonuclease/exonuclease/phosphatase family metal-dependent hydrolase
MRAAADVSILAPQRPSVIRLKSGFPEADNRCEFFFESISTKRQERKGFQLGTRHSRKAGLLLAAAALIALAIPAVADAKKKGKGGPKVTMMTRNLFLGADLAPALEADSIPAAIDGAGEIHDEFESTNFRERAPLLAEEIKDAKPDLVGLQEVATWYRQTPSDGGAPPISPIASSTPATDVEVDFLAELQDALKGKGPKYEVVAQQEEFSGELPVDADQNDATGTGPLATFGADFDSRLVMHDVILEKKGSKVKTGKIDAGHYATRFEPSISGVEIPVDRGWLSVEAKVGGPDDKGKNASASKKKGGDESKFRFINTHLEAFGDPTIREAQAKELIAGPADTNKQVVLVGDLNSGLPDPHNIGVPGFGDPNDPLAFQAFVDAGFKDNGARQSCCDDPLDPNPVFDHTVDHVLTRPGLKTKKAFITGDEGERSPSGLAASDHRGVVSRLQLKK